MSSKANSEIPQDCRTATGSKVAVLSSSEYRGYAEARIDNRGTPFIVYNSKRVAELPELFRTFAFYHECAHIYLGHVFQGSSNLQFENSADCWSVNFMSKSGYIDGAELRELQNQFRALGWSEDSYHLSAEDRATNISKCLGAQNQKGFIIQIGPIFEIIRN